MKKIIFYNKKLFMEEGKAMLKGKAQE